MALAVPSIIVSPCSQLIEKMKTEIAACMRANPQAMNKALNARHLDASCRMENAAQRFDVK